MNCWRCGNGLLDDCGLDTPAASALLVMKLPLHFPQLALQVAVIFGLLKKEENNNKHDNITTTTTTTQ